LEYLGQRKGLGLFGKQEVLCHLPPLSFMRDIICDM
jgi:hypothetical protein